jgi:hypothetical protein
MLPQTTNFTHEITIGGVPYVAEWADDDAPVIWLHKGEVSYQISYAPDGLTGAVNTGLSCECESFRRQHAYTPSHGCRHIKALCEEGLLPARPDRLDDESDFDPRDDFDSRYEHDRDDDLVAAINAWH